ncbi:helix-turn-helix domain-containing protein [Tepidicaulis sp.]|uniref:helix-turn-helix domain-containing protein n=1 Tax=Tepidicaulis sp. TaxID=1920809 RepID=UPI003B5CF04D
MRKKSPDRLDAIVEAALTCFSQAGYARTQMADVARAAHVSAGTLYLYAASKEALLHLAVLKAAGEPLEGLELPFATQGLEAVNGLIRGIAGEEGLWPVLTKALESDKTPSRAELQSIGAELYDLLVPIRRAVWLLDKLVLDIPEIDQTYADVMRGRYIADLSALIARLPGAASPMEERLKARMAIEIISWAAMHRRKESERHSFAPLSEEDIRRTATAAFAASFFSA